MLIFLDESFRTHRPSGNSFGVLSDIAIPEDVYARFTRDFYSIVKPYHGTVLREDADVHGSDLLTNTTLRIKAEGRHSGHWSLAEDLINYSTQQELRIFGVVCFRSDFQSFRCANERKLDMTFQYLFERVDVYMRDRFPRRLAKLIFDDRGRSTNEQNARAITGFFLRSNLGSSYDTIIKSPFYGLAKTHCYGLQLADVVTTVIGLKFQGDRRIAPLWRTARKMLYATSVGGRRQSSLKVMRTR